MPATPTARSPRSETGRQFRCTSTTKFWLIPHIGHLCVSRATRGLTANNVPHKEKITPVQCQTCHKNVEAKHPFHQALLSKAGADVSRMCKECHGRHDVQSPKIPGTKFSSSNIVQSCGECHGDVKEKYLASAHGKALIVRQLECAHVRCMPFKKYHRGKSRIGFCAVEDIARTGLYCMPCEKQANAGIRTVCSFVMSYEQSVHGMALKNGNGNAANCVDCHGSHEMKKGATRRQRVNRLNIPNTCAKCHASIAEIQGKYSRFGVYGGQQVCAGLYRLPR